MNITNGRGRRTVAACFLTAWGVLPLVRVAAAGDGGPVYDAADLVRASRMVEGIIPADPAFADLDGDGEVTADDLDLMLRRVHGMELPVRLDRQTIGPEGGDLGSAETLTLTVPPGAFDDAMTLTIERRPAADAPAADIEVGPLYEISGIPDNVGTSLTVRIAVPEGADPALIGLRLGEYTHASTSGEGWYYREVETEPDGNALIWRVPPIPETRDEILASGDGQQGDAPARTVARSPAQSAHSASYRWRIQSVGSHWNPRTKYELVGERFRVIFPTAGLAPSPAVRSNAWVIVGGLEDAYAKLAPEFDFSPRSAWPVDVYLTASKDGEPGGDMVSSKWGLNYNWIEIDRRFLSPSRSHLLPVARITAGHEFFHIVQSMYHARTDTLWLDEATATWFEKHITDGDPADYVPPDYRATPRPALRGLHIEPISGWFSWDTQEASHRGYVLASLIEFLDRRFNWGVAGMVPLYTQLKNNVHPVAALMAVTPGDFKPVWQDYTRAVLLNAIWPAQPSSILIDPPPECQRGDGVAFGNAAQGPYGVRADIDQRDDFATLRELPMQVQQLGGRSLALFRMNLTDLDHLPDPIKLIGEADWLDSQDMANLRLVAVLERGPGPGSVPPAILAPTLNDWDMVRSTRRIEVSFPRPTTRFSYMLAVFNDDVNAPYNRRAPVVLRSYIGAYRHPEFTATFNPFSGSTHAAIECLVRDVLLEGDLGTVRASDTRWGADLMGGSRHLAVILPHDDAGPLRLKIDGLLQAPLERVIEEGNERWTVTVTDDLGWRLSTYVSGDDSVLGPVVPKADAWSTGFELPVPATDGFISYAVSYFVNVSVLVEDTSDFMPRAPYTFTTDSWYVAPLTVSIQGRDFTRGGQQ